MATLYVKPYQLRKLIEVRSQQETLGDALEAVVSEVNNQLGHDCPKCGTTGLIDLPQRECDYCDGWGRTTSASTKQVTYTPAQPIPTLTIDPQ